MAFIILAIMIGVPAAEIWVLIEVGSMIGGLATVAAIIGTAVLGTALFRIQGTATLLRVQDHLRRNEMPIGEMLSGLGLLVAGLMLLIPGFVTDAFGFLLFLPPLRRFLMSALAAWMIAKGLSGGATFHWTNAGGGGSSRGQGTVIDGEFDEVPEPPEPPAGQIGGHRGD